MVDFQYFVAASLDGFIATDTDELGWLLQFDGFDGGAESYADFMAGIGCIAVGGATFSWLINHAPSAWPYPRTPCWVFTHQEYPVPANADVTFVRGDVGEFIQDLEQAAAGLNVWVMGGGNLAAQFAAAGRLDELILSVIPVVLGNGKRLLPLGGPTTPLQLTSSRRMGGGIVENRYRFPVPPKAPCCPAAG